MLARIAIFNHCDIQGSEVAEPAADSTSAEPKKYSLNAMPPGRKAVVTGVVGSGSLYQRILELGIIEGRVVEMVRVAPLGDPLMVRVEDYLLSIRKSEAACIRVKLL